MGLIETDDALKGTDTGTGSFKRPITSGLAAFATAWLRDPVAIGSIVPSGRALAAVMAQHAAQYRHGTIIEIGAGTGAITAELFSAGISRDRLYLVERNPQLVAHLRRRFGALRVVEGDASRLRSLAERDGLDDVCLIVSSLPLRNLSTKARFAILHQSFRVMGRPGDFIQFTYSHLSPVPRSMADRMGITCAKLGYAWRNLPPASVWQFRQENGRHGSRAGRHAPAAPSS